MSTIRQKKIAKKKKKNDGWLKDAQNIKSRYMVALQRKRATRGPLAASSETLAKDSEAT